MFWMFLWVFVFTLAVMMMLVWIVKTLMTSLYIKLNVPFRKNRDITSDTFLWAAGWTWHRSKWCRVASSSSSISLSVISAWKSVDGGVSWSELQFRFKSICNAENVSSTYLKLSGEFDWVFGNDPSVLMSPDWYPEDW